MEATIKMEIVDFKIPRKESSMECMRISSYSISAQELHHSTYHNHRPGNMYGTFLNSQLPSYLVPTAPAKTA